MLVTMVVTTVINNAKFIKLL